MAKPVDKFEPRRNNLKYNWEEWADGRIWELEVGKDFQSSEAVREAGRYQARKRGMRFQTSLSADGQRLFIKFSPKKDT